jgi:hypothetical protein
MARNVAARAKKQRVAKAFVRDMRAVFAAPNTLKQDEIAARQLQALNEFRRPRDRALRLADVREMFLQMKKSPPG